MVVWRRLLPDPVLSIYLSSIYPSIHPFINPSIYPFINSFIHPPIDLPIYPNPDGGLEEGAT